MTEETALCCCGSGRQFAVCCKKYIIGESLPQTAEQLMRSRYSAYVMQNVSYLKATWHNSTCPDTLILDPDIRWIGLEIKNSEAGVETDQTGTVEFVAKYKLNGRAHRLQEVSRFVKQGAQWLYLEASNNSG